MKSLRRSYDKKRSTIRWMKQTQLQLKLSPVKTKAIQTRTCVRLLLQWGTHSGVSARDRRQDCAVVLIMSSAWRKFTQRRTTARRSTTVAVNLPLFARIFLLLLVLDGVDRLFGHDQAPSKCLPQQQVSGNLLFSPLALLCPVDGSFIHHCLYFSNKIFAVSGSDWSRRAATQQTSSKFLVPRKSMKAYAILSMLVVLAAAESATEDRFQRRRPTRLTLSRTQSARSSRRSKAMELSTCENADTESGRVLPKSPSRKTFRESLYLYMSTRSRFLCDRRPTSASRKLEICATRATNKVHIDEQPCQSGSQKSEV